MIVYKRIECLVLDWIIECLVLDWISGVTQLTEGNAFLLCSVPTAVGQKQTRVLVPHLFTVQNTPCWMFSTHMYLPTAVGQKQTSILVQCLFHCPKHALLNVLDTQCISTASSIFNATPSLCLPLLSEQSGLVLLHQFSQMVQKESGIDFLAHGQVHLLVVFVVFFSAVICVSAVTVTKESWLFYHHYQIHQTPTPLPFCKPSNSCYFQYHDCVTTLRQIWNVKWLCPFFMPPAPVCFKIIFMYYTFWIIYLLSCEPD